MKKKIISSSIVAGFLALLMILVPIFEANTRAEDAGYDSATHNITYFKDSNYAVGTEQNHYTILELVPTQDMATVGYLVTGQGKVSEDKLESEITGDDNSAAAIYNRLFASNIYTTDTSTAGADSTLLTDTVATAGVQQNKLFPSDVTTSNSNTIDNFSSGSKEPSFAQYGYFVKVENGKGRYNLTSSEKTVKETADDGTENTTKYKEYKFTLANNGSGGNYNWVAIGYFDPANFSYTGTKWTFGVTNDYKTVGSSAPAKKQFFIETEVMTDAEGYYYILDEDGKKVYTDADGNPVSDGNKVKSTDNTEETDLNGENTDGTKTDGTDTTGDGTSTNQNGTSTDGNADTTGNTGNGTDASGNNGGSTDSTETNGGTSGTESNGSTTSPATETTPSTDTTTTPEPNMGFNYDSKSVTMSLAAAKYDAKLAIATKKAMNVATTNGTTATSNSGATSTSGTNADSSTGTGDAGTSNSGTGTGTGNTTGTGTGNTTGTTTGTGTGNTTGAGTGNTENSGTGVNNENNGATVTDENNTDETKVTDDSENIEETDDENSDDAGTGTGKKVKIKSKGPRKAPTYNDTSTLQTTEDNIAYGYSAFQSGGNQDTYNGTLYKFSYYPQFGNEGITYSSLSDLATLENSNVGTKYYTSRFDKNISTAYSNVVTNNDVLAKEILGKGVHSDANPDGAYIDVISLTPTEINDAVANGNGADFINDVDMIIIHDMLDARLVKDSNDYKRDLDASGSAGAHLAMTGATSNNGGENSPAKGNDFTDGWDEEETDATEDTDSTVTDDSMATGTTTDSSATDTNATGNTSNPSDSTTQYTSTSENADPSVNSDTTKVTTEHADSSAADTKIDKATDSSTSSNSATTTTNVNTGNTSLGTADTTGTAASSGTNTGSVEASNDTSNGNAASNGTDASTGTANSNGATTGDGTDAQNADGTTTENDAATGDTTTTDTNAVDLTNPTTMGATPILRAPANVTVTNTTDGTSKFHGDDAAGLLESAVNSGLIDVTNLKGANAYESDGKTRLSKENAKATRGYFTYNNDISKQVLELIVKRQAGNNPAAMVLDSSAIYEDSMTQLTTIEDGSNTVTEESNYHDGVPAAVRLELVPDGGIADVQCGNPTAHKDLHTVPNTNQVKTRKYTFKFTNNAFAGKDNGGISPEKITLYLPRYVFYDEYANKGSLSTVNKVEQTVQGNYNVLTIYIRNKKDNDSFFGRYTPINDSTTKGELYLCSSFDDVDKLQNFDITKYPVYTTVTDGDKEYDVMANKDVAEYLNELYIIMNYYGAKYYWNVFCASYDDNGNFTGSSVPDPYDYSIKGISSNENTEHTYPLVTAQYDSNYPYSRISGDDAIQDALVPLTKSTVPYDYNSKVASTSADGKIVTYESYSTMLDQPSFGNGVGKSPFVWDFDGNRSAFSTAFNMSGKIATTERDNKDGTYTPGTVELERYSGIAKPDDISTTDAQNLSEVFDDRFLLDESGNVVRDAAGTAVLIDTIKRPTMMSFIDKESNGYNGTTGDKYKTSLKILEIEPTDDYIYGSYYRTEANDGRSKSSGTKYYNKMGGTILSTNIDYYSNYAALKAEKVYVGNSYSLHTGDSKKLAFNTNSSNKIMVNGLTRNEYIHYENTTWKDWKEYYYSMFPGFIGTDSNGDLSKDVTIETVPIWKFNSVNTDINSEYDIVVVGATQNYKNGQLKRMYSYGSGNAYYVDTAMSNYQHNNLFYRRYISYNDSSLESYDHSLFTAWNNAPTPPSHDTFGDPSYALAWTAVGDLVDTSIYSDNYKFNQTSWTPNGDRWDARGNWPNSVSGGLSYNSILYSTAQFRLAIKNNDWPSSSDSSGLKGSDAVMAHTRTEARDFTKKKAELLLDYSDRNLLVYDDAIFSGNAVNSQLIDSRSEMYYIAGTSKSVLGDASVKNSSKKSDIAGNKALYNVRKTALLVSCEIDPVMKASPSANPVNESDNYNNWPVEYYYSGSAPTVGNCSANAQKVNDHNGLIFEFTVGGRQFNDDGSHKNYYATIVADINNNAVFEGSLLEQRKTYLFSFNDTNKDGVLDSDEVDPGIDLEAGAEKITELYVYDITDPNNKTEVTDSKPYPYDALHAGRTYSVEGGISGEFVGALGYTLQLSESANPREALSSKRDTKTGFTRFNNANKTVIHVLQMNPDNDMSKNDSSTNNNTMRFYDKTDEGHGGKKFYNNVKDLPDFEVKIDFLRNNNSTAGFKLYDETNWQAGSFYSGGTVTLRSRVDDVNDVNWPKVAGKNGITEKANKNFEATYDLGDYNDFVAFLENYDMVFLAGRDVACVSNNPKFIKGLNEFAQNGGSIIMSHDMIGSIYSNQGVVSNSRGYNGTGGVYSAGLIQYMQQTYFFRKLGGQVVKYYTPGTTNYSYNTMYANTSVNDRPTVTSLPLEDQFLIQKDGYNYIVANDMRFIDQYDYEASSEYLNDIIGDSTTDTDSLFYNKRSTNNAGITIAKNHTTQIYYNSNKYPAVDHPEYYDGSFGTTRGQYADRFASLVSDNDIYNLRHYGTADGNHGVSYVLNGSVNSFGLDTSRSDTDLAYDSIGWSSFTTSNVKNINKGKVSTYPYNFGTNTVHVMGTHLQQYRLDLDHTNINSDVGGLMTNIDDDTMVWYDLGYVRPHSDAVMYGYLDGDAANNYYIYTKGAVTYTGVGHANVNGDSEIQLFINTMIASYRPTAASPYIRVMNNDASTVGNKTTIYFDESTGSDGNVVFRVMDPSLSNVQRSYYVKVYKLDANGNEREVGAPDIAFTGSGMSTDPTWANKIMSNGETNFTTKVTLNTDYSFPGTTGETYRIHLMYATTNNRKTTNLDTWQDVTLQNLEYFDLY